MSRLDESSIGQKLEKYELSPPAAAWNKIAAALDAGEQTPVKKIRPWWQYAVAAAVVVTFGLGIVRLTQPAKITEETARHQESTPVSSPVNTDLSKDVLEELVSAAPSENEDARNDAALEASKKTYAKLEYPAKKIAREVSGFYFNAYQGEPGTRQVNTGNDDVPVIKHS